MRISKKNNNNKNKKRSIFSFVNPGALISTVGKKYNISYSLFLFFQKPHIIVDNIEIYCEAATCK